MAVRGGWKEGKMPDMQLKEVQDAWRQRIFKETGHTALMTRSQIEDKLELLQGKNSYFHNFQNEDVVKKNLNSQRYAEKNAVGFSKVFEQEDEPEDFRKDSKYQQLHKLRSKRQSAIQEQHTVTTSAQQLGWLQPYDNFTYGNNRSGMCMRSFTDKGHL